MTSPRVGNQDGPASAYDEPVHDPYQIWDRFLETILDDIPSAKNWLGSRTKNYDRINALSRAQHDFNVTRDTFGERDACTGIAYHTAERPNLVHQCQDLFCPAYWMLCQQDIQGLVEYFDAPYWYLRATEPTEWNETLDSRILKDFRTPNEHLKLVGWTVSVDPGHSPEGRPTCYYQYIGIWLSTRDVNPKGSQLIRRGEKIGGVEVWKFSDKHELLDRWIQMNQHPDHLKTHSNYKDYVFSLNRRIRRRNYTGSAWVAKHLGVPNPREKTGKSLKSSSCNE
jgi:hypothetical protein